MMQQPAGAIPPPMAPTVDPTQQPGGVTAQPYGQPPVAPAQQPWMVPPHQLQQPPYQPAPAAGAPPPQMWAPAQYSMAPSPVPAASAAAAPAVTNPDEIRSLWIGDLQYWMDENYLFTCFLPIGEVQNVKVIRNKQTNHSECYGFIEFNNRAAAERALASYNGALMPQTEQPFRLNWATLGAGQRRQDDSPDHTLFVGDLAADVTDLMLQEAFRAHYSSVKGAKVITDHTTGRSKGYGFVRFGDESEQTRAMNEMNGAILSTRPMRLGPAANKKPATVQQKAFQNTQGNPGENDPTNTTIFVGGLDPSISDDQLRQAFSPYGELIHVKIPVGRGCGFVQFANRNSAEQALAALNGAQIGSQNVRLSWGRSPSAKQTQPGQAQWNGGGAYYGYTQGYDAYGYAPAPQDPNMYYANYAGYGNYQQTQQ